MVETPRAAAAAFLAGLVGPWAALVGGVEFLQRVPASEGAFLAAWTLLLTGATVAALANTDVPPSVLVPAAGLGIATTHAVLPGVVGYGGAVLHGVGAFAFGALLLGTATWFAYQLATGRAVAPPVANRRPYAVALLGAAVGAALVVAIDAADSTFQRAAWPDALALVVVIAALIAGFVAVRRGVVRARALWLGCGVLPFLPLLVVWDSRWFSVGLSTIQLGVLVAALAAVGGLAGDRVRARSDRSETLRDGA